MLILDIQYSNIHQNPLSHHIMTFIFKSIVTMRLFMLYIGSLVTSRIDRAEMFG